MCPSYRATLDERHATRGRGNALRLAITGQIGRDAASGRLGEAVWDDAGTRETLHLCLSCKACKSECPSNVDIARLKAEYTAQRYRAAGGPPLASEALRARVRVLNRLGSLTPRLANWVNSTGAAKWLARRLLGIDERRAVPRYERVALLAACEITSGRERGGAPRRRHSGSCCLRTASRRTTEPSIGMAAVRVLAALGYGVEIAPKGLAGQWGGCCGRAMISTGLLEDAIETADRTIEMLRPAIEGRFRRRDSGRRAVVPERHDRRLPQLKMAASPGAAKTTGGEGDAGRGFRRAALGPSPQAGAVCDRSHAPASCCTGTATRRRCGVSAPASGCSSGWWVTSCV